MDPPPPPRLLDRVRMALRTRHCSLRTEKAYVGWIRRFILFHGKRHPAEMGAEEITRFLSALAIERNVAASTQNQALSALLFLYKEVLAQELPWLDGIARAKTPARILEVLTRDEVRQVIAAMDGPPRLAALLLYGAGLRLLEALRLRVKDVDFQRNQITVRSGKGAKDRVTMLPAAASRDLAKHLEGVREMHLADVRAGARSSHAQTYPGLCNTGEAPRAMRNLASPKAAPAPLARHPGPSYPHAPSTPTLSSASSGYAGLGMRVFVVQHEHEAAGEEGRYEVKFIGVYATEERAHAAIERAKILPGFRDYPDCFSVDPYEVDMDHWTSGFVSIHVDD